jgi:hypothetical protein
MEELTRVKSHLILEARSLSGRGSDASARPLYQRAAELESELADLYTSLGRSKDAWISLLSAGSCLVKARMFSSARAVLERIIEHFPEAQGLLDQCGEKDDELPEAEPPAVKALVNRLVQKHVITEEDWAEARKPS